MNAREAHPHEADEQLPTLAGSIVFRAKAACFQALRAYRDSRAGLPRHTRADRLSLAPIRGEWSSELWREGAAPAERRLQLGKVQNLRVAARALHGLEIPAGGVFSFWRQLGRATRGRGYAVGRELREGCLIPSIGGGLCQLSGAIYNAALEARLEVVERHAHSQTVAGSLAQFGRDATVFWNYVDLRLRAEAGWRLEVVLSRDVLTVRIRMADALSQLRPVGPLAQPSGAPPNSCATCGIETCFRHQEEAAPVAVDRRAVLVDEWWPEWGVWLSRQPAAGALLCRPLDGRTFRKPNYQWDGGAFGEIRHATVLALRRAWAVRRLREQGAARQRELLAWDEKLARAFAKQLRPEHTHLTVAQSLLPFLWRDGVLGGRTFDVLMSRLPLQSLHDALDRAAALHPESGTCADFRVAPMLVAAESAALQAARRWVTPHAWIARLAGERAELLPWQGPAAPRSLAKRGARVVFPAATLCRKGACEVREVARALDAEVVCLGGFLEGADFWSGVRLVAPGEDWLEGARAVVLPAFVEHRPRRLLEAIQAGVPVIASPECGMHGWPGVIEVPAGNAGALLEALEAETREVARAFQ